MKKTKSKSQARVVGKSKRDSRTRKDIAEIITYPYDQGAIVPFRFGVPESSSRSKSSWKIYAIGVRCSNPGLLMPDKRVLIGYDGTVTQARACGYLQQICEENNITYRESLVGREGEERDIIANLRVNARILSSVVKRLEATLQ